MDIKEPFIIDELDDYDSFMAYNLDKSSTWSENDFIGSIRNLYHQALGLWPNSISGKKREGRELMAVIVFSTIDDIIELLYLSVGTQWRHRGLGSALLEELIKRAKADNVKQIFLEVNTSNKNAISLYEKYGFKLNRIRKNYYYQDKKFYDAFEMNLCIAHQSYKVTTYL